MFRSLTKSKMNGYFRSLKELCPALIIYTREKGPRTVPTNLYSIHTIYTEGECYSYVGTVQEPLSSVLCDNYNNITELFLPVLQIRIRSDPVFLGHPDPDPGKYRTRIIYPQKDPCSSNFLVI